MIDPSKSHAVPRQTIEYLTTIFPSGWAILYCIPGGEKNDKTKDAIGVYSRSLPNTRLLELVNVITKYIKK